MKEKEGECVKEKREKVERVNEQKGKNNFPFSICQILDAVVIARAPSGGIL